MRPSHSRCSTRHPISPSVSHDLTEVLMGCTLSLARKDEKTFYFHGALEGEKMDCIASNQKVALSAVTRCTPTVGPKDNSFTLQYKSAMAIGVAEVVTDRAEKIEALRLICQRFLPHHMDAFAAAIERSLERTAVVKISLTEPPTGKRKQYDKQGEEMNGLKGSTYET